jgi:hypothetical protein
LGDGLHPLWIHTQTDYYKVTQPDYIVHIENITEDFAQLGIHFDPEYAINPALNRSDKPRYLNRFNAFTKESLMLVND